MTLNAYRLSHAIAAAVLFGSAGSAHAVPVITNGSFEME